MEISNNNTNSEKTFNDIIHQSFLRNNKNLIIISSLIIALILSGFMFIKFFMNIYYEKNFMAQILTLSPTPPLPTITKIISNDLESLCGYKNPDNLDDKYEYAMDCGDFKILLRPCCDNQDIILDKYNNKITECGGKGYFGECEKYLPLNRCEKVSCKNIQPQTGDASSKEECLTKGGIWQSWGPYSEKYCQIPASDADKSCMDGSECTLGKCISRNEEIPGKCQIYKNTFGCYSFVEKGQIGHKICFD
jgi:hypothetical protein